MDRIHICPACEARKRGVKSRIAFVHNCGKVVVELWGRETGKKFAQNNTSKFEDLPKEEKEALLKLYYSTINDTNVPVWDRGVIFDKKSKTMNDLQNSPIESYGLIQKSPYLFSATEKYKGTPFLVERKGSDGIWEYFYVNSQIRLDFLIQLDGLDSLQDMKQLDPHKRSPLAEELIFRSNKP